MSKKFVKGNHLLKYPSVFSRWYLFLRGKSDAKRGLLDKNDNDFWVSAFINKEIYTALADIEYERDIFYTNNTNLMLKMDRVDLIKRCIEKRKPTDVSMPHTFPSKSSYVGIADSFTQFIMDNCLHNVLVSQEFVKSKKHEYHEDVLFRLDISKLENKFTLMRDYTSANARATRVYDILVARLSVYWSGVRRFARKNEPEKFPVTFDEDSMFGLKSVQDAISKYFVDMEDAEYGEKYLPAFE